MEPCLSSEHLPPKYCCLSPGQRHNQPEKRSRLTLVRDHAKSTSHLSPVCINPVKGRCLSPLQAACNNTQCLVLTEPLLCLHGAPRLHRNPIFHLCVYFLKPSLWPSRLVIIFQPSNRHKECGMCLPQPQTTTESSEYPLSLAPIGH